MKPIRPRYLAPVLMASLIAALSLSCATMPDPTPAYDVKSISGKWMGWAVNERYGRFLLTMVVRQEGTFTATSDTRLWVARTEFDGNLWVDQDEYHLNCTTPELSGRLILYSQKDTRWLAYKSTDGLTSGMLKPIYK